MKTSIELDWTMLYRFILNIEILQNFWMNEWMLAKGLMLLMMDIYRFSVMCNKPFHLLLSIFVEQKIKDASKLDLKNDFNLIFLSQYSQKVHKNKHFLLFIWFCFYLSFSFLLMFPTFCPPTFTLRSWLQQLPRRKLRSIIFL